MPGRATLRGDEDQDIDGLFINHIQVSFDELLFLFVFFLFASHLF